MKKQYMRFLDNRNTSRLMALVLSLLLCISIIGIIASAASVTKDGLEVTLTTDKEEYSAEEPIEATLSVENKGNKIIDEVNLETLIPDGYHIESSSTATKNAGQIGIGEKAVLEVTLLPDSNTTPETPVPPETVTPNTPSEDGKASSNSDTNKQGNGESDNSKYPSTISPTGKTVSSDTNTLGVVSTKAITRPTTQKKVGITYQDRTNSNSDNKVSSVNTEDESQLWVWTLLAVFSFAGIIAIRKGYKSHSWKKYLSFMLVASILVALFSDLSVVVEAKEMHCYTITVKTGVTIDSHNKELNGVVTVNPNIKEYSNGDYLYIPTDDDIDFDQSSLEFYFNNYLLAYTISPFSEKQLDDIARLVNGTITGKIEGPTNVIQVKVGKKSKSRLSEIANVMMENENIYYASYDVPLVMTSDEDKNPWPDADNHIELDKGNETNPSGNDWWAEAIGAYSAWEYDSYVNPVTVAIIDNGYYFHDDLPSFSYLTDYSDNHIELSDGREHGTHVAGLIAAQNNDKGIRGIASKAKVIVNDWSVIRNGNVIDYLSNGEYVEIINQMLIAAKKANTPITINNSWFTVGLKATIWEHLLDEEFGINIKWDSDYTLALNDCFATASHCVAHMIGYLLHGYDDFMIFQSAGNGLKKPDGSGYNEGIPSLYNGSYASITEAVYNRVVEKTSSTFLENHNINYLTIKDHIMIVGAAKNVRAEYGQYYATSFSNYGETVDIFAPGENIISTVDNNGYDSLSGTSMATPIACGSAALLWSLNPELSAGEIKRLLINSGNNIVFGVGIDDNSFYPMLNINYSIEHSPFYENLKDDEQPSIPGDISGIDDSEPANPSEPTAPGDVGFASGKGTQEDPYVIMTPEQLNSVRYHLDANYVLGADIDMSSWENWEPIGTGEPAEPFFSGVFDGNNHIISNLRLGKTADVSPNHSLFGEVTGRIKNVLLKNLSVAINNVQLIHDGEIENWAQRIGGICLHGGTISNCQVDGTIKVSGLTTPVIQSGASVYIGGVSAGWSEISNCESNVDIEVSNIEKDIDITIGGIIAGGDAFNSINRGSITTHNLFYASLGGIVGTGFWAKIDSCVNYGNVCNFLTDKTLQDEYLYGGFLKVGGITGDFGTTSDVKAEIVNCKNYAKTIRNDGEADYVGRIWGADAGDPEPLEYVVVKGNYSIKETTVNGTIPETNIGHNKKNGENM